MKLGNAAFVRWGITALALGFASLGCERAAAASSCKRVVLDGEVSAGQVWQSPIGQGWVFRIQPIQPSRSGYSGWDLVVDRDPPAGYPDALLLATLPYNSINEREVGTTFGLRAQDAIGWNPRSFHFLTDPVAFREAQRQFPKVVSAPGTAESTPEWRRMLELLKHPALGELRIEDSRLTPGVSDAAPFAQAWALAGMRARHQVEPAIDGKSSPRGAFLWMRFSATMWFPASWKLPPDLHGIPAPCVP